MTLNGDKICLRALEPTDLDFVFAVENNESVWEVSNTQTPYSKFLIKQYLENAHQDIYEAKQLRLAICDSSSKKPVGLVDLFDFDPKNNRAGIGIVINNSENRNLGIGQEAIGLLVNYAFTHLNLHQLYANINANNAASLKLFAKFDFVSVGVKKDWIFYKGKYSDEILFQLINTNF